MTQPLVNNITFLQTIFKQDVNQTHVCVFHEDPYLLEGAGRRAWAGGHWGNMQGLFTQGGNQYFTISTFSKASDGAARRRKDLFRSTHVIVIDDVGTGPSAKVDPLDPRILPPSYMLETSPGNCQYGYILASPETIRGRVDNLLDGMVSAGITEDFTDPGQKGVTRYVRLPEGTNNKQKYVEVLGRPFDCAMKAWNPVITYTMEQLALPFHIDLDAARENKEGVLISDDDHPGLLAFSQHWHVKSELGEGRYDVVCPRVEEHTDPEDDTGTAIWTYPDGRLGMKCHHGHGDVLTGSWVMKELFRLDPGLSERVASYGSAFTTIAGSMGVLPAPAASDQNLHSRCMMLQHDSDFNTEIIPLLQIIARLQMETERDDHLQTIADQTGRRVMCLRSDVRRMIRENHRAMTVNGEEPEWVHVTDNGTVLSTLENFRAMMQFYQIRSRYNEMTKSLEIAIPGEEFRTDTAKNAQLLRIESFMIQHSMNHKQAVGWCNYAAQYDNYHPLREYLDMAGIWDGVDRISTLADTLIVDTDKVKLRNFLLKRWLVSVVAAALRDTDTLMTDTREPVPSPRGVFTLQGPQYMGKTRWFRRISPPTMFKEGLQLGHDKDSVKQATNALIVEIGEADTSTKMDAGRVKAFISRDYDELRVPWDKAESRWPRRTVFGGTVNPSQFLVDSTGNSRWWVVPVKDINFALLSVVDIRQLWLQVEQLWISGEPYLLTNEEMAQLNDSNESSQEITHFEEMLVDVYDMEGDRSDPEHWLTSTQIKIYAKGAGIPTPARDVCSSILNRLFGSSVLHGRDRLRMYKMPARRIAGD